MKRFLFFFTAFLSLTVTYGQKQGNIWYFGNHAGLDFNNGTPVALTDGETYDGPEVGEGTSVISDMNGNLLFYTNGQEIWNRNHMIMPNGDSLLGSYSSSQAALIVPQPGSNRYFYVFTTDGFQFNLQNGLRYSIVDICLDGGLGDVIPKQKNIKLLDLVAEKQTAVRHSNGTDYWIIVHKYLSNAFYAFQLSSNGIIDTVITHIGSIHQGYCGNPSSTVNAMGTMKASPDGNKLAIVSAQQCNNISELFDFNKSTGVISNLIMLRTDSVAVGLYGVSFSPDNSKLYVTSWINNNRIYQYDLSSGNPTAIVNSKNIIASQNGGPWYMAMQLGPDGKLYIAERNQGTVGVIHFPNLSGISCNYENTSVSLNGKINALGLPNFIDFFDYSNSNFNCLTGIDEENINNKISIFPNPFSTQTTLHTEQVFNNVTLSVYNLFGQTVNKMDDLSGQTIILHRDNLPNGLYFIHIRQGNITIRVDKLVINDN